MADRIKLMSLVLATLAVIAWFIGQGLTLDNYQFFLSLRLPKVLAIIFAAVAISASSLVFQTVTNNRILTPAILGFDSLYLMVQVLLVVIFGSASYWVVNVANNFLLCSVIMIGFSLVLTYRRYLVRR